MPASMAGAAQSRLRTRHPAERKLRKRKTETEKSSDQLTQRPALPEKTAGKLNEQRQTAKRPAPKPAQGSYHVHALLEYSHPRRLHHRRRPARHAGLQ